MDKACCEFWRSSNARVKEILEEEISKVKVAYLADAFRSFVKDIDSRCPVCGNAVKQMDSKGSPISLNPPSPSHAQDTAPPKSQKERLGKHYCLLCPPDRPLNKEGACNYCLGTKDRRNGIGGGVSL